MLSWSSGSTSLGRGGVHAGVGRGVAVGVGLGVRAGVGRGVGLGVGARVGVAVGSVVGGGVRVEVGEGDRVGAGPELGVALTAGVAEGPGVVDAEAVGAAVEGLGLGDAPGTSPGGVWGSMAQGVNHTSMTVSPIPSPRGNSARE
jgi:hypothetical protein